MKPELRALHSPDFDLGCRDEHELPDAFVVLIEASIGSIDEPGEDTFQILVCSPEWISQQLEKEPLLDLRHHLAAHTFDIRRVRQHVEQQLSTIEGETWDDVANKLRLIGYWEFEDYQDHQGP